MKKTFTLLLTLITYLGFSQSYNLEHFATPGDEMSVVFADSTYNFTPTPQGENQTWNFSDLQAVSTEFIKWSSAENSFYIDTWCYGNGIEEIDCVDTFSDNFTQFRNVETGYVLQQFGVNSAVEHVSIDDSSISATMFGFTMNGIPTTLTYNDPDILYQFPFEYGNSFTDDSSCIGSLYDYGLPMILNFYGTREVSVNGTGTLILPHGEINNVLRVRTQFRITTILTTGGVPYSLEEIVYQDAWFHPEYKFPVMLAEYQYDEGVLELGYIHYVETILSTKDSTPTTVIYPNPTTGIFHWGIRGGTIYDSRGKRIGTEPDLTNQPSGIYFVEEKNGKISRIIKN